MVTQRVIGSTQFEGEPVKGSRFIVHIAAVVGEAQAHALLAAASAAFPDASHHCSAWRIATPAIDRASDDGEPSGSAGRPILSALTGRDLVDTAVIVTRYFGGTKLGVGGLVRAYGGAASEALDTMAFEPWVELREIEFDHDYTYTDAIERLITDANGSLVRRSFAETVSVHTTIPVDQLFAFTDNLANLTGGAIQLDLDTQPEPSPGPRGPADPRTQWHIPS